MPSHPSCKILHHTKLPDNILKNLQKVKTDYGNEWNDQLVGNIKNEYLLNNHIPLVDEFLLNEINSNPHLMDYAREHWDGDETNGLRQETFWINFQKKYEFNPVHLHSGVFSFIIFLDISYTKEECLNASPGLKAKANMSGVTQFIFTDELGKIKNLNVLADKTNIGEVLIFPATLHHCVYPFYLDGYRITLSGNINFNKNRKNIIV